MTFRYLTVIRLESEWYSKLLVSFPTHALLIVGGVKSTVNPLEKASTLSPARFRAVTINLYCAPPRRSKPVKIRREKCFVHITDLNI